MRGHERLRLLPRGAERILESSAFPRRAIAGPIFAADVGASEPDPYINTATYDGTTEGPMVTSMGSSPSFLAMRYCGCFVYCLTF